MARATLARLRRVGLGRIGLFALTVVLAGVALELSGFAPGPALAQEVAAEATLPPGAIVPPKLTLADYPTIAGVNSRIVVWLAAQLHLWFAAFVLAVPIFVLIIESLGVATRDQRYDRMAYEFIKVSITAY